MDDLRELGNPKETIRYDHDPHFCMGVIEGEIKDCELAVGGDPYEREAAPDRGKLGMPALAATAKDKTAPPPRCRRRSR